MSGSMTTQLKSRLPLFPRRLRRIRRCIMALRMILSAGVMGIEGMSMIMSMLARRRGVELPRIVHLTRTAIGIATETVGATPSETGKARGDAMIPPTLPLQTRRLSYPPGLMSMGARGKRIRWRRSWRVCSRGFWGLRRPASGECDLHYFFLFSLLFSFPAST